MFYPILPQFFDDFLIALRIVPFRSILRFIAAPRTAHHRNTARDRCSRRTRCRSWCHCYADIGRCDSQTGNAGWLKGRPERVHGRVDASRGATHERSTEQSAQGLALLAVVHAGPVGSQVRCTHNCHAYRDFGGNWSRNRRQPNQENEVQRAKDTTLLQASQEAWDAEIVDGQVTEFLLYASN